MNKAKRRVGYSTQHALTKGIEEVEVEAATNAHRDGAWHRVVDRWPKLYEGRNLFWNRWEAVFEARQMAKRKMSSLRKQLHRMAEIYNEPHFVEKEE